MQKLSNIPERSRQAYNTLTIHEKINLRSNLMVSNIYHAIAFSKMSYCLKKHIHKGLSVTNQPKFKKFN